MTNHQNTITNNTTTTTTTKQAHVSTHHHLPPQDFSLCAGQFGFSEPQMVRTVSVGDVENPGSSDGKGAGRKGSASRTKHSETEQRRRSKINERFEMLRRLIPETHQKRDKASFLLEVIEHIKSLHKKLQSYEGSCHGWSPESSKLTLGGASAGPFESFIDQSHLENQLSGLEDDLVLNSTLISEVQNSVVSDFTGAGLYKPSAPMATSPGLPLNIPMPPPFFESMPGGSLLDAEQLNHPSQSRSGRSSVKDYYFPLFGGSEEEPKSVNGEDTISSAYSQGLADSLTTALQSSGVDTSQTNISVQLDMGKRTNNGTAIATGYIPNKDLGNPSGLHYFKPGATDDIYEPLYKRLRTKQN